MPLHRFDNQDFDRFVRDKFESAPTPSFDPQAWDAFEVSRRGPIFKYWVSRGVYIVAGLLGLLFLTQFAGHIDQEYEDGSRNENAGLVSAGVVSSNEKKTSENSNSPTESITPDHSLKVSVNNSTKNSNGELLSEEGNENNSTLSVASIQDGEVSDSNKLESLDESKENSSTKANIVNNTSTSIENRQIEISQSKDLFGIDQLSSKNIGIVKLEELDVNISKFPSAFPSEITEEEPIVIKKERAKINNRLVISALLNADLSTVAFDDFTSPGVGLGVRLSYKISNRFTVGAGFTRTKRIYNVSEGTQNYALPQWLIDRQGSPSSLAARCDITEIPVSLRYDIISSPNSNLYGQLSASTFFMDREFYDFQFEGSNSNVAQNWVVDRSNVNKHFFGVVGLTFGYEKYFTKRIGLGVEFYWQTTLQGIGIYQINLNSVGNQILLNYRLF